MKKSLDEALFRDFPLLYRDREKDFSQTNMCWGFPGDGWEPIIRKLSTDIEAIIKAMPTKRRQLYRAAQVKEKFGALRFYMTTTTSLIESLIADAEELSRITCEHCGAPGELVGKHWVKTLCPPCHTKDLARLKK